MKKIKKVFPLIIAFIAINPEIIFAIKYPSNSNLKTIKNKTFKTSINTVFNTPPIARTDILSNPLLNWEKKVYNLWEKNKRTSKTGYSLKIGTTLKI